MSHPILFGTSQPADGSVPFQPNFDRDASRRASVPPVAVTAPAPHRQDSPHKWYNFYQPFVVQIIPPTPARRAPAIPQAWLMPVLLFAGLVSLICVLAVANLIVVIGDKQQDIAKIFVHQVMAQPLKNFHAHTGQFPTTAEGLPGLLTAPAGAANWQGPYLASSHLPKDPWGSDYTYRAPGAHNPSGYDLSSPGPDQKIGTPDDIGNW